jgi:probable HAF family extracellular repeat protein
MGRRIRWSLVATVLAVSACSEPTATNDAGRPLYATGGSVTVASVDPSGAPQGTTLDVTVTGSGYDKGSQVAFLLGGTETIRVKVNRTTFVSSKQLTANVSIASDAVPALYDVRVTTAGGKKGIGTERFAVELYVELGTFGGSGSAADINEAGIITGNSDTLSGYRAFVWSPVSRVLQSLGPVEGDVIDEANTVYGLVPAGSGGAPARWRYDAATGGWGPAEVYPMLTPESQSTFITAANDAGQAAGRATLASLETHLALWPSPASLVDLGMCPGANLASGSDINATGQITGYCRRSVGSAYEFDAFVWTPAVPNGTTGSFMLLPRYPGLVRNFANGINDQGEVVGYAENAKGAQIALLWRTSGAGYQAPIDINGGAAVSGIANDINNASAIVGARLLGTRGHQVAFIWDAQDGARNLVTPGNLDAAAKRITQTKPYRIVGWTRNGDYLQGTYRPVRWLVP